MKNSFVLGKIRGIAIEVNISWIVIFGLMTYMLATNFIPQSYEAVSVTTAWIVAVIMVLLFFVSVLLHELAHSLTAIRDGIEVKKITLFIFGGLAQIEQEADDPGKEFRIAIAGPVTSLLLGGLFYLMSVGVAWVGGGDLFVGALGYLSTVNVILALFNLVPAFPLDGGRVLRAIIWKKTKDRSKATRIATMTGSFFGYLLIFNGVFLAFSGNLLNGVWMLFIGWFITQAAQTSYQQVMMSDLFNKICVRTFMTQNVVEVPYFTDVKTLVEDYFYKYKYSIFPVRRIQEIVGVISLDHVRRLDRTIWDETTVGSIVEPLNEDLVVAPGDCVSKAMEKVFRNGVGRVLVMEEGQLLGIVSRTDILNYIRIHAQLGSSPGRIDFNRDGGNEL
jgi:Zn-dependent protease